MFGIFNIKKENNYIKEHPEFINLSTKWNVFLDKINVRFEESVGHAEEAVLENLIESNYEILPTTRAWHSMKSQLQGLTEKIEATFERKVKPQMLAYKEEWELIEEDQKGTQLCESIYDRIERYERIIEGKIGLKFYEHAIELIKKEFNCTQCNAKLKVKKDIFRSHYVNCDYCNTVNTFTPNTKITEIRSFAIDNIAKYKSIEEWDKYKAAQNSFNELRPPKKEKDSINYINGFKKREETERAYWTKYFTERITLLPEYEETLEHDIDVKMNSFYKERKHKINF